MTKSQVKELWKCKDATINTTSSLCFSIFLLFPTSRSRISINGVFPFEVWYLRTWFMRYSFCNFPSISSVLTLQVCSFHKYLSYLLFRILLFIWWLSWVVEAFLKWPWLFYLLEVVCNVHVFFFLLCCSWIMFSDSIASYIFLKFNWLNLLMDT